MAICLAVSLFSLLAVSASFAQTSQDTGNIEDGHAVLPERRIRAYTYLGGDEHVIRQTVKRITKQDGDAPGSWVYEWRVLGEYFENLGDEIAKRGPRRAALDAYVTSVAYYALAWFPRITNAEEAKAYESGRLHGFDPESTTKRLVAAVTSNFTPPRRGEIPHVDVTRDVNHDGRDDLLVPDADGFWLLIQMSDGAFADPVKIGPATELDRIYGADGYRYDPWSQSRIHEIDYDRDGRSDLVFWNEDHFEVHLQDARGLFAPVARTFTTDVAFDSDDLSSLATGDMTGKVLHSLADLSGDGVADLVVFSLEGTRISSKQSTYEVHFGAPAADGGTTFAREVGAAFRSEGHIQLGLDRHDFDRDGQVDLMFTTIRVWYRESSLWKKLRGFMGDDIVLDLEFYRSEGGVYPGQPDAIRRIQLDGAPSHREAGWVPLGIVLRGGKHENRKTQEGYRRAFNRTLLIGDVTGDGRSDLLIESSHREVRVFVGVSGPDLFARRPQRVGVAMPNDEEYTWLVDLNKDGKQDILMHHPSTTEVVMERDGVKGIKGWLLVYLIGSIPLLMVYSMGLSGWFFDYPAVLMVTIFVLLAVPLVFV